MPAHLDGDAPVPHADGLDAAIVSIDERIAEVEEHRQRLARLRDAAVDGAPTDALPRRLTEIDDAIEAEIGTTGDRRALALLLRGQPPGARPGARGAPRPPGQRRFVELTFDRLHDYPEEISHG